MEGQVLYYEKLMVYGHIESNRKYLSPEDLTYHQMWLLKEGHCLREQIIDLCSLEPGNIKQNISFQPNTFDSLLNLVDKFGGLTLLPELYYKDLDKERKSKVMQFDAPYPVREVSLVYYRPFVKQRILQMLTSEIITLIALELKSSRLESTDLRITKINKT
jgi:LysR family hydrogen peroxide-inducible transcriptional activator